MAETLLFFYKVYIMSEYFLVRCFIANKTAY